MQTLRPTVERIGSFKAGLGESAIWHAPDESVLWVDISGQKVLRTHVGSGQTDVWPCSDGSWLVGQHAGILRLQPKSGRSEAFAALEPPERGNRTNDAACDRFGKLWVGTMKLPPGEPEATGALYRLGRDGTTAIIDTGLYIPNGIAFSPGGDRAYWADTYKSRRMVWQAQYDAASGRVGEKSAFVQLADTGGRPDGAAIDAAGCYWVAAVWGWQLLRFTPQGELDLVVDLPVQRPSKLVFGGADLKTIFITTISDGLDPDAPVTQPLAGHLLAINLDIQGLPPSLFGQA
jgi:sugar lactone lactonase YvrE